jgi:predicted permease
MDFDRSLRVLARHPWYSLAVVFSLAIGISAAAGTFAVVESAHYGRLPYANGDRIEQLYLGRQSRPGDKLWDVPAAVARALQTPDSPVEALAAYQLSTFRIRLGDRSATATGHTVSDNFPQVLGAHAELGRLFGPGDADAVVLSHDFWQSEFAGDSAVVGKAIQLNGRSRTIVGVVDRSTAFPEMSALWQSGLSSSVANARVAILALIKRGISPEAARARIATIGTAAAIEAEPRQRGTTVASIPLRSYLVSERLTNVLLVLTVISLLVGVIAAVNFAALMLARGIRRRAEIGVRAALGASVARLAREIVAESILLCAIGGALGALLAPVVVDGLRAGESGAFPGWMEIAVGWRTVAASVLTAVAIGIVFGLGPAMDIARPALTSFLRGASGTVSDGAGLARLRSRLVAIQVALATGVLVALGALLGKSLTLSRPDPGFNPLPIVTGTIVDSGSMKGSAFADRMDRVVGAARVTPGVVAAAMRELNYVKPQMVIAESEHGTVEGEGNGFTWVNRIGDGFFSVMRPRVIAGRLPNDAELARQAPVVVITRSLADELYDGSAIGRRLWPVGRSGPAFTVVGVIENVRERGMRADSPHSIFLPLGARLDAAGVASGREIWLRYEPYVPTAIAALRRHLSAGQLGGVEVARIESMKVRMEREAAGLRRVAAIVLTIFGVALGLAALGIYGLVAYTAEMRARELAIREAVGATRLHIAGRVLRGALMQAVIGTAAGAGIATLIVEQLNSYQLKLTAAAGTTAVAFVLVGLTVLAASMGPVAAAWRRDLSATLRVSG